MYKKLRRSEIFVALHGRAGKMLCNNTRRRNIAKLKYRGCCPAE